MRIPYAPIAIPGMPREGVRRLGTIIGRDIVAGTAVALYGNLGAGKTFLIQAICEELEVYEPVTSPTFTLVNAYRGRLAVFHVDLYRIERREDLDEIGLEEIFGSDGVVLVEWAEKASNRLPSPRLDVELRWSGSEKRDLKLTFVGDTVWDPIHCAIRDEWGR
jgi:tRNA threonylcarbamoyladenosine biosynthesis protein TsaE